jgi:hypothetical protein
MGDELTPAEVLEQAKGAARLRQIRVDKVLHARDRSTERNVQSEDIRAAVLSSTSAEWSPAKRTWRLRGGKDLDGDALDVVLAVDENTFRVITVC